MLRARSTTARYPPGRRRKGSARSVESEDDTRALLCGDVALEAAQFAFGRVGEAPQPWPVRLFLREQDVVVGADAIDERDRHAAARVAELRLREVLGQR